MALWRISIALFVFLLPFVTARAADTEFERNSLIGLSGVHVAVSTLDPYMEDGGLQASQVVTDIELRLRKTGIPVFSYAEVREVPGKPLLYLSIESHKHAGLSFVSLHMELKLIQGVLLDRDRSLLTPAVTWSTSLLGGISSSSSRELRADINDMTDAFLNAYLAVNPRSGDRD